MGVYFSARCTCEKGKRMNTKGLLILVGMSIFIVAGIAPGQSVLEKLKRSPVDNYTYPDVNKKKKESSGNEQLTHIPEPQMIKIRGGSFSMGENGDDQRNRPAHTVTVSSFYMSKYEVTQKEYFDIMKKNPSKHKHDYKPVENISWWDAIRYCNARSEKEGRTPCYTLSTGECDFSADGYRLPTEAEWEYACRAGTTTPYFWGATTEGAAKYANFADAKINQPWSIITENDGVGKETAVVGSYEPNQFGLYDMIGNVWEWCNDWYLPYNPNGAPQKDPIGPLKVKEKIKIIRGTSFGWAFLESAHRIANAPRNNWNYAQGLRPVRSVP